MVWLSYSSNLIQMRAGSVRVMRRFLVGGQCIQFMGVVELRLDILLDTPQQC